MANTTQVINTKNDGDLIARLVAAAEMKQIPNAQQWVYTNLSALISEEVEAGQTIADVYSYAREVREGYIAATPPPPGLNLGAVTDSHMNTAIDAVYEAPVE